MMLIKTEVRKSPIDRNGLFALEFVPKGTIVWRLTDEDRRVSPEEIENANGSREHLLTYCFFHSRLNAYIYCADNGRFINHSPEPNVETHTDTTCVATRDIHPGEEIVEDYRLYDKGPMLQFSFLGGA